MPTVKVRNLKNEEVADLELSDAVFGAEYNEGLVHAAVKNYLANARAGTVGTKTRGDVSGSGKKLWTVGLPLARHQGHALVGSHGRRAGDGQGSDGRARRYGESPADGARRGAGRERQRGRR